MPTPGLSVFQQAPGYISSGTAFDETIIRWFWLYACIHTLCSTFKAVQQQHTYNLMTMIVK